MEVRERKKIFVCLSPSPDECNARESQAEVCHGYMRSPHMWGILLSLPLGVTWTKTEAYAHGSVGIIGRVQASDKVCTMPSQGYFFFYLSSL